MIPQDTQGQIITIWDKYISNNKKILDTKGTEYEDIDTQRLEWMQSPRDMMSDFIDSHLTLSEFKYHIDGFNKEHNLWGFTSIKGQMFFNLLLKTSETEEQTSKLTQLIRVCVVEPKDLQDALEKIDALERYVTGIFYKAPDKRKAPNPGSIGYFLSYFWQIHNHEKWPIMYSSMIVSFTDIGLWKTPKSQKEAYNTFFNLNDEVKQILSKHTGKLISNWEAEHAFWNFRTITAYPKKESTSKIAVQREITNNEPATILDEASFDIYEYIPRIVENLIELGNETEMSGSAKGSKFEKAVAEIFKQLGFAINLLGQGHRDPDLIAIHKEENVAFIIDAKAYANGYALSASDDRAIREYINHHCPKLKREGIQKIGFIIVSNLFKPGFDEFINDITWKTDIKRFILLSSNALLHLLAYRLKDQKSLTEIVDALISLGTNIKHQDIVRKFNDY